jgi:hypothetical protein
VKVLAVVVLLAASASAAPQLVPATATPAPSPAPQLEGAHSGGPYWFKTYSTAPYKEIWSGDLSLRNFERDLPKAVAAIQGNGGVLTQPLANFVSSRKDKTQQIVFTVPRKSAEALLKSLRALGDLPNPKVQTTGVPIPLDEVRAKITVMMKEKTDRAAELARVPAAAAAEEEILEHLLMVEEVAAHAVVEVRFDMTVRQK